jgi:ERCC4-type nuclease
VKASSTRQPLVILADTREQLIPPFPLGCEVRRHCLAEADYTTELLLDVARIERKSPGDFASTITWERDRFDRELARLLPFRWKCIVVESDFDEVFVGRRLHPHAVLGAMASLLARWDVPVLFAGSPEGTGRLMAGLLKRWEERVKSEAAWGVGPKKAAEGA